LARWICVESFFGFFLSLTFFSNVSKEEEREKERKREMKRSAESKVSLFPLTNGLISSSVGNVRADRNQRRGDKGGEEEVEPLLVGTERRKPRMLLLLPTAVLLLLLRKPLFKLELFPSPQAPQKCGQRLFLPIVPLPKSADKGATK